MSQIIDTQIKILDVIVDKIFIKLEWYKQVATSDRYSIKPHYTI